MIFQHTHEQVMNGTKTQTSRIVKPDSNIFFTPKATYVIRNGRTVYETGKTYAVQPGRTKPAIARIRILGITQADVREYDEDDAERENCPGPNGGGTIVDFWITWVDMHDKVLSRKLDKGLGWNKFTLLERPAELYRAWKIIFEVVE